MMPDLSALDRLAAEHPALASLHETPWGRLLLEGARPLARYLAHAPTETEHWLVRLLRIIAAEELGWMRQMCRHSTLRAGSATASILCHLHDQQPTPEELDEASETEDPPEDQDPQAQQEAQDRMQALRDFLEEATGTQIPEEMPMPDDLDADPEEDAMDVVGAEVAQKLEIPSMAFGALDELAQQNRLMEQLHQLLPGAGWGQGTGGALEQELHQHWDRIGGLMDKLQVLTRIADELGRMERAMRSMRRASAGGREDVMGVHFSGELADVLPCELALLADPGTEDLFYQRYTEQRLLSLEMQGKLQDPREHGQNRGPVIACVDTSGSMMGAPEAVAKALILSTLRRILPQGRSMRLILFGGRGEGDEIEVRRGARSMEGLLRFLAMSFHAGTDFDSPLVRAMALLEQDERYERADVLVITDGLCRASHEVVRSVDQAREERKFRVVSVVIGGDPSGVEDFSDQIWMVQPDEALEDGLTLEAWDRTFRPDPPAH